MCPKLPGPLPEEFEFKIPPIPTKYSSLPKVIEEDDSSQILNSSTCSEGKFDISKIRHILSIYSVKLIC